MRDFLNAGSWKKRKTILVVDDDADLRLGVEIRLKANGYDVVLAGSGDESIEVADKYMPDLILLDLGLPAGDGYSVMERLRASTTMHLIPVVISVGAGSQAESGSVASGRGVYLSAEAGGCFGVDGCDLDGAGADEEKADGRGD